jgi:hypothetical protein
LERLGQDSGLRHAPEAVLERALSEAQMIPELRAAILEGNQRMLETLLGASSNVCCMVNVPIQQEDEDEKPRKASEDKHAEAASSQVQLSRTA